LEAAAFANIKRLYGQVDGELSGHEAKVAFERYCDFYRLENSKATLTKDQILIVLELCK